MYRVNYYLYFLKFFSGNFFDLALTQRERYCTINNMYLFTR